MSQSDTDIAIDLINKQLDSVASFYEKSLTTTENIIKRLEKLEWFKMTTTQDIDEMDSEINELKNKNNKTNIDLFDGNIKDKIVRNFLELNKDIADQDVQRLMAIPMHKRQNFQKEDLDNIEQVYWACKILLEYIGEADEI